MSKIRLGDYSEVKPYRFRRVAWGIINKFLCPVISHRFRIWVLRQFGAKMGEQCAVFGTAKVFAPWNLEFGDYVCIAPGVELYSKGKIIIGNHVTISQGAYLCTAGHDVSSPVMALKVGDIHIADDVWVAARATVLPGVTLAEGAVVGACAVVSRDVPAWKIVAGNPARIVKDRVVQDSK